MNDFLSQWECHGAVADPWQDEGMHGTFSSELIDYAERREAQERAAAKRAPTLAARGAHQELAQLFAAIRLHRSAHRM